MKVKELDHVGCCDSPPNTHTTKHFKATEHSIIRSFEPGMTFINTYN